MVVLSFKGSPWAKSVLTAALAIHGPRGEFLALRGLEGPSLCQVECERGESLCSHCPWPRLTPVLSDFYLSRLHNWSRGSPPETLWKLLPILMVTTIWLWLPQGRCTPGAVGMAEGWAMETLCMYSRFRNCYAHWGSIFTMEWKMSGVISRCLLA